MAATSTTYLGEVAPTALRGLLTCMIALAYTVGPLVAALILNSTGTADTRWAYRAVCYAVPYLGIAESLLCTICSLFFLIGVLRAVWVQCRSNHYLALHA